MSQAQTDRQNLRTRNGRYAANPCDCCGKGCKVSAYFSDERSRTTGFGVILCEACADLLAEVDDAEYVRLAEATLEETKAWKRSAAKAARAAAKAAA